MKKLVSILLIMVMILTMSTTALAEQGGGAEEEPTSTTITIQQPTVGDTTARTYSAYQLLTLETSHKEESHYTDCPYEITGKHVDACYNYAYSVNPKYVSILQQEVFDHEIWTLTNPKPATVGEVDDEQIKEYLSKLSGDNGEPYGTLREAADRIYLAIKTARLDSDKSLTTGENEGIAQGYWLIADTTTPLTTHDAHSLVLLNTKAESELVLNPKTAIPTVEKKVRDIDDSEDNRLEDNAWLDSADYDIDDTIQFKLTVELPSNVIYYETYELILHDKLSAGLTLKEDSVKVLMYETKYKADADTGLGSGTSIDVTNYQVETSPTSECDYTDKKCSFEVIMDNVLRIPGVKGGTAFVVYYEATLNNDAVIGSAGNPNQVYLEFTNDPYYDATGNTAKDKVVVYTYELVINKIDNHGHKLEGAGFTLYKEYLNENLEPYYKKIGSELKSTEQNPMTTFTWTGLDDGDYKLVETTVPKGYNKMEDVEFSITATHRDGVAEPELLTLEGGKMGSGEVVDGKLTGQIEHDIENRTGAILPSTGGTGTVVLVCASTMLVMLAAVFMITRKKMSVYEI